MWLWVKTRVTPKMEPRFQKETWTKTCGPLMIQVSPIFKEMLQLLIHIKPTEKTVTNERL